MKRKFIYLSSKGFDGTVFITQVADWLNVYDKEGVTFDYFHLLYYPYLWNSSGRKKQIADIANTTPFFKYYSYCFPSRGIFVFINAMLWHLKLMKFYRGNDEILIFSRNILGKEIDILKKLAPIPIIFYYDARAASAEENKYSAAKQNNFSFSKFKTFTHIFYTEYKTVTIADRIFAVSNVLKKYFSTNYNVPSEKVFIYPCLSDASKFYFDSAIRVNTRNELGFTDNHQVFLYAGGIAGEYHIVNSIFGFFDYLSLKNPDARFLLLSRDNLAIEEKLKQYPALKNKLQYKSVANNEMINYLNTADFGLLLRDNVLMNNVASPSKFAEYMLCGLPCIISEGVGDYTEFCRNEGVGVVVNESEMNNWNLFDYKRISEAKFDRISIAGIGQTYFSKQRALPHIIKEFKCQF